MRIANWKTGEKSCFGVIGDGKTGTEGGLYDAFARSDGRFDSLKSLLTADHPALAALAKGAPDAMLADVRLQPPIASGAKIICVGVNYPERNAEYKDGSTAPAFPSLFVRFASSFVGHGAPILRPPESGQLDYEGEIVLVIGRSGIGKAGRRIPQSEAQAHIAGLTLMNEGSIRDWIRHGKFNVTQGKNFERSGAIGPWIMPVDASTPLDDLTLVTKVNGEERQRGNTGTLMFPFARIIEYVSTFTTLEAGDLIATGTPPGAGGRFEPPKWLKPGDFVEISCAGIGTLSNPVADEEV